MNEQLLTPEDQRQLDRLVDGEVSETERRELLLRLEHSSDGWRRCALAFLEAQAWRGEAKALVSEPATPLRTPAVSPASTYRGGSNSWNGMKLWLPLATAAGFLLAVGYFNWFSGTPGVDPSDPQNLRQLANERSPGLVAPAGGGNANNLQLVVAPGPAGDGGVVEVPLVGDERMQETLYGPMAQQIPPEVERMLQQAGNQVVRERRLMPIQLPDGRRVIVPVEQVEIRPLGSPQAFQ
ncbi:MAG: hypothetical protein J0M17_01820 [Planctomycetes bacterium]|nr:hypothetical protein [Planctomycetota bacterium]